MYPYSFNNLIIEHYIEEQFFLMIPYNYSLIKKTSISGFFFEICYLLAKKEK